MQTQQLTEFIFRMIGVNQRIYLPVNFDAVAYFEAGKKDFTEIGYFEPNFKNAIETETKKFEAGKSYEFKLQRIESNGPFQEFIEKVSTNGWFVGGANGMILFWGKTRWSTTKYKSGFCLSPTSNHSQLPYIYKGDNSLIIFGSKKGPLKKDEKKDFYNGKYIVLFRER